MTARLTKNQISEQLELCRLENDRLRNEVASLKDQLSRAKAPKATPEVPKNQELSPESVDYSKANSRAELAGLYCRAHGTKSVDRATILVLEATLKLCGCPKCNETGTYAQGTDSAGECYMCAGKGFITFSDKMRNHAYWRFIGAQHNA